MPGFYSMDATIDLSYTSGIYISPRKSDTYKILFDNSNTRNYENFDTSDTDKNITVNSLYNDIRYNNKTRYNDSLNGSNPQLKMKRIIGEVKKDCT